MAKQRKPSLSVETSGTRHYITVPAGRANELHNYLRSKNVRSAPPEPAYTGCDYIELAKDIDVGDVQAILDDF